MQSAKYANCDRGHYANGNDQTKRIEHTDHGNQTVEDDQTEQGDQADQTTRKTRLTRVTMETNHSHQIEYKGVVGEHKNCQTLVLIIQ